MEKEYIAGEPQRYEIGGRVFIVEPRYRKDGESMADILLLFRFLVEPAANGLKELLRQSLSGFSSLTEREQNEKFMEYSDRGFEAVIAYIYEYFSEFKLLITGAPGNYYQEFLEGLVELDTLSLIHI